MALQGIGGGGGFDYVQSTTPTGSSGETWLDTSLDPPIAKVYADLGGGGQWTTDLTDAQISTRSSHSDPDPNGYIDTSISSRSNHNWDPNNRIDAVVSSRATPSDTGTNWASKTNDTNTYNVTGNVSGNGSTTEKLVNGSGYLMWFDADVGANHSADVRVELWLDGNKIIGAPDEAIVRKEGGFMLRFNSSMELYFENSSAYYRDYDQIFEVRAVLD